MPWMDVFEFIAILNWSNLWLIIEYLPPALASSSLASTAGYLLRREKFPGIEVEDRRGYVYHFGLGLWLIIPLGNAIHDRKTFVCLDTSNPQSWHRRVTHFPVLESILCLGFKEGKVFYMMAQKPDARKRQVRSWDAKGHSPRLCFVYKLPLGPSNV